MDEEFFRALHEEPHAELSFVKTYILTSLREGEDIRFLIEELVKHLGWRDENEHLLENG